jgi:hypothetical protein
MQPELSTRTRWTNESIIELLRKVRNDLIKDFLDERFLRSYASKQYHIQSLSNIKIEFIKAELKDLLIQPVDVPHYQPIIDSIKESDSASLSEGNEVLFYRDIEKHIKKHLF